MKTLQRAIALFFFTAACWGQNPTNSLPGVPNISVGQDAPNPGQCSSGVSAGNIYVRSENSANGPIQVLRCTQVGNATFQWMSIDHFVGPRPAACAVGDIAFDTNATAGQNLYGCTAPNTWTALGSVGGSSFATLSDGTTVTWAIGSLFIANASLLFTTHGGSRTLNITGSSEWWVLRAQAHSGRNGRRRTHAWIWVCLESRWRGFGCDKPKHGRERH